MTDQGIGESLLRVRPQRVGEQSLREFANVLESLGEGHVISLEVASGDGVIDLLVRTAYPDRVVAAISSHYPGAEVDDVTGLHDPLEVTEGQTLWRKVLRPEGEEFLPLQTYDEDRPLGSVDPLIDVFGSVSAVVPSGERLVTRVLLKKMPHDWSEAWRSRAMGGPGGHNQILTDQQRHEQQAADYQRRRMDTEQRNGPATASVEMPFGHELIVGLAAILTVLVIGVWLKKFYDAREYVQLGLYTGGAALVVVAATFVALKFKLFGKKSEQQFHDPQQVATRISGGAFQAEIQVLALVAGTGAEAAERAEDLLEGIVNAYRAVDSPIGSRLAVDNLRRVVRHKAGQTVDASMDVVYENWLTFADENRRFGPFAKRPARGVIGVREAAALWHPPGESSELTGLRRAQSKHLAPPLVMTSRDGALVGTARLQGGGAQNIRFPPDVTRNNIFMVARTGAGKSTFMCHIAGEAMLQKAMGDNGSALVVIDPHGDLVNDVLERVPSEIMNRVVLVDLGDQDRALGINLLDIGVFKDRDITAQMVVDVARGTWEAWGSRMESIIQTVMQTMHEANEKVCRFGSRSRQLTMLEAVHVLKNRQFRDAVLDLVDDENVKDWWRDSFGAWNDRTYGVEALAPVITRLTAFSNSKIVRALLGQGRCSVDLRAAIERGDIVLVNTNQAAVGPEISSLLGVSIIKLIDSVVRGQGEIQEGANIERQRVQLIMDELQTFAGADVESMLAELRKFGLSVLLATQSLTRLDAQRSTMKDSILSNAAALMALQMNAVDARLTLPELRSAYLTEEDITGQPAHHAYVRLISDGEVQPAFSMHIMPPSEGDPAVRQLIREGAYAYTRNRDELLTDLAAQADDIEGRIEYLREVFRRLKDSPEADQDNGEDDGEENRPVKPEQKFP